MYEILAPAGGKDSAVVAIKSGANAIYLGYSAFSARASADNFDWDGLREIIAYAHLFGVKVYVAMNTLVKQRELDEFIKTLVDAHNAGADGILLQDVFLGKAVHEQYPDIILHLSTQAGLNNVYGATLAKSYGFSRVVLARETAIEDIRAVSKIIETEAFVQGALCTCLSGQCYLSSFIGGNSGNRGRCKQPCRKKYTYDTGDRKQNYALSLADLSVGKRISELMDAGVTSYKIEGRLRRPEYVAAAVQYYQKLFNGESAEKELSALKRAFNRGNYTEGLAFGQDKRFLSKAVQGHIGEKVGVVKVVNGKYYVESNFKPTQGDGFKILRSGEEVGGGSYLSADKRGFFVSSKTRLKNGDSVFITTDTALNQELLAIDRKLAFKVTVFGEESGVLTAQGGGVEVTSAFTLQTAKTSPMTEFDIQNCFKKVDEYPFEIDFERVELKGNCFIPKSMLNAFRREFYGRIFEKLTQNHNTQYAFSPLDCATIKGREKTMRNATQKVAVIGGNFEGIDADIYILKPENYADKSAYDLLATGAQEGAEKYLYLPAFMSEKELQSVAENIEAFDGVYGENSYALVLAQQWGKKLFAGTGFNLSNAVATGQDEFAYFALSKELDFNEQKELTSQNAFVLTTGDIKVMDLLYCPFEKKCGVCEKRSFYTLADEAGRNYLLRRYKTTENTCRFELFNPAILLTEQNFANVLIDLTTLPMPKAKGLVKNYKNKEKVKEICPIYTSGHSGKSVL